MISYQDKTFCDFWRKCKKGDECHRALTKEDCEGAEDLGLPVSIFVNKPKCFEVKDD